MNQTSKISRTDSRRLRAESGAALVVGLILLLVLTVLAISGMTTASLELQMAGNEQYQERAFQAAEAGIEQAIDAAVYNTNVPVGSYNNLFGTNPTPIRGTGQQIESCTDADPDGPNPDPPNSADAADSRECEYFLRFDQNTGITLVPGGGYSLGTGFQAYHFVVDSHGTSSRGAESEHTQSFYIIGPGGT
jgi:type IV pilus assembly protein PilX